jgi:hypothetical protein
VICVIIYKTLVLISHFSILKLIMSCVLVGNSFPLALIRRSVQIRPVSLALFRSSICGKRICSFWGHSNTLSVASQIAGHDLSPQAARPVVTLSDDGFPMLDGQIFTDCWVLSPDYVSGFRPAIGEEVGPEKIIGWQVLHLVWEDK